MRILLVGRSWVGKKMLAELIARDYVVTVVSHTQAIGVINAGGFDWVVNCHGLTGSPNVDACELDVKRTMEENAAFPILLYDACEKNRMQLAHWSSGCIYQGAISSVKQNPNFFGSAYSASKAASDAYLQDRAMIFRIRMPFTNEAEPKNLLYKIYNYAKNAKLYDAGHNSLTDIDEAVKIACDILDTQIIDTYNLVNSGSVTLRQIADLMHLDADWYTESEFKAATRASRSTCVIPDSGRMRPVEDALIGAISSARFLRPS